MLNFQLSHTASGARETFQWNHIHVVCVVCIASASQQSIEIEVLLCLCMLFLSRVLAYEGYFKHEMFACI